MGYTVEKIFENTWLIVEEADCNVYMYLLAGSQRAVLLDAGYGSLPLDEIIASLTDLPVTLLCTHGHFDHIGGVGYFPRVLMHSADREVYLQHRQQVRQFAPGYIAPEPIAEPEWFETGFEMDLGDRMLEVFCVPGHTKGCIAVLDVENRVLFTGDTCCKAAVLLNFDHSTNVATFRNSINTIVAMAPRYDITWPSHHARPVEPEVPVQFLEACDRILSGQAQPKVMENPFGTARMLPYKDICILY